MKKVIIIFGTFVFSIIVFATLFKLMHWPGAGPLFVIGMSLFAGFFLPLFFIERMMQRQTALNIITNLFGFFTTGAMFMGVLFKLMHWPGAGPMIVGGATLFVCPTLILYVVQQFMEYDRKFSEFWRTVVMGVLVSVFLLFWGLNISRNVLFSFITMEDAILDTNKNLKEYNTLLVTEIEQKAVSETGYATAAENIHSKTLEMNDYIAQIKAKMILQFLQDDTSAVNNHWYISATDNYDIPTYYLGTAQSEAGKQLFDNLNAYKVFLKERLETLPLLGSDIDALNDFGVNTNLREEITQGYTMQWNEGMFANQTVAATLALLTSIQNEVLNAEFKSLKLIVVNAK